MKPAAFEMVRPQTLDEALAVIAEHMDGAMVIAGGQSLVPLMNFRLATPGLLIDLNRIAALVGIRRDGDWLRIGAMTRQSELVENELVAQHTPLLRIVVPHIGHVQTRSRGTIGGSLAHADPSAELPLVMVALDAVVTVQSRRAHRTIAAREFFIDAMVTALAPDELLTEVAVPIAEPDTRCSFLELARRKGDFAIVAVATQFASPRLTIAVGGLESRPRCCTRLIEALGRRGFSRHGLPELISAELDHVEPLSDLQASADYRRHLAAVLLERCLEKVLP
jgi:2-furoyl-CoA dehydrogenase FAD binding subunit